MPKHRLKGTEDFIAQASIVHQDKYTYKNFIYKNTTTESFVTCSVHGDFLQKPTKHLAGQGCPICSPTAKKTTEQFIEDARAAHGDLYDYSRVVYTNAVTPVKIVCKEHGEFSQRPHNHVTLKGGCPSCAGNAAWSTESFVKMAKEIHGDLYDYSDVKLVNSTTPVNILCTIHGVFKQTPRNHVKIGCGCPRCNKTGGYSWKWLRENPDKATTPATLYLVEITTPDRSFYKIGITKNILKTRFKDLWKLDTSFTELASLSGTIYSSFQIEQYTLRNLLPKGHLNLTNINIGGGETECFSATPDEIKQLWQDVVSYSNSINLNTSAHKIRQTKTCAP